MLAFSKNTTAKIVLSLLLFFVILISFSAYLDHNAAIERLDQKSDTYLRETLKRAVYTYAVARGINAAVSVVQNTDLLISPGGIGATLAIGEILDPINDLIERFSWLMVLAITSLGLQTILAEMGACVGFKFILPMSLLLFTIGLWIPARNYRDIFMLNGIRIMLIALVVRLLFPLIAITNDTAYQHFLEKKYTESSESIGLISKDINATGILKDPALPDHSENMGLLDNAKQLIQNTNNLLHFKKRLNDLKDKVSQFSAHIINLIVVFLLQTIIIPLFVLWLLSKSIVFVKIVNFHPGMK